MCETTRYVCDLFSVLANSALIVGVTMLLVLAGYGSAAAQSGNLYLPIVLTEGESPPPPVDTDVRPPANFAGTDHPQRRSRGLDRGRGTHPDA